MFNNDYLKKCKPYLVKFICIILIALLLFCIDNDNERPCTMSDVMEMDYLERVIKETLRLFPPVPMIGREIEETVDFG